MSAVSSLLDSKGRDVLTVTPDQPVLEAAKRMADQSAGTALVMRGGDVVGILSERDVFRVVVLDEKRVEDLSVEEIMTTDLTTVSPETPLEDCMRVMTEQHIRHLPVLRDKQLRGIISIGDVVKYLIVEKDFKIRNLETYISGSM